MVLIRRATLLAFAVAMVALAPATAAQAAGTCAGADIVPDATSLASASQVTLCLVNAERAAQGIAPLSQNGQLDTAATAYATRLVGESFFAHQSPDGGTLVDRLTAAGYIRRADEWAVGENLAWAQGTLSTPAGVVKAWMDSPGHRANVLNRDYTEVGLGAVPGTPGNAAWGATFVHEFGRRDAARSSTPSATAPIASRSRGRAAVSARTALARARSANRHRCAKAAAKGNQARGCTASDARKARAARAARAGRS